MSNYCTRSSTESINRDAILSNKTDESLFSTKIVFENHHSRSVLSNAFTILYAVMQIWKKSITNTNKDLQFQIAK